MKVKKEMISEKFSEKKKRGRPRLLNAEDEKVYRRSLPARDIRTLQNQDYEVRALRILGLDKINPPDYPFLWLGDYSKIDDNSSIQRIYRKTILAELGRIKNKTNLKEAATEICHIKPKAQEAIKMIRSWRMKRPLPDFSLKSTLQKVIEDCRKKHPDLTNDEIYKAISFLEEEYLEKIMLGK